MTDFERNLKTLIDRQVDGFISLAQWDESYRKDGRNHKAISMRNHRIALRHSQHKRIIYVDCVPSDAAAVDLVSRLVAHL